MRRIWAALLVVLTLVALSTTAAAGAKGKVSRPQGPFTIGGGW
ncbi:hypothetical protein [Caldinitratiruptor microaerophilus]|uniref:Uncharacterized protein n=1 Tax=Caldinitratiruptor microaerophilus TaxID=671077 RepID=A0AA35CI27_9FIRM|nr:hypothetical protein [Caldinitratiruptor microaerophilus]BDG59429.1 hypothetical protein caldi_05190 [Caldinitratiruptor microaerophilus]